MHTRFDDELDDLYFSLSDMASTTEKSLTLVTGALSGKEQDIRAQVEKYTEEIKRMYRQLEGICMHLLLRRQPVASDLRRISSIMRIITDLERIGDNSADVVEVLGYCTNKELFRTVQLDAMCAEVEEMLSGAMTAFLRRDVRKAKMVVENDDTVDEFFRNIRYRLTVIIKEGQTDSDSVPDLMMIAKYLERMGDHAASIASWVVEENTAQTERSSFLSTL